MTTQRDRLIAVLLLAATVLAGCSGDDGYRTASKYRVLYWHDEDHAVSCWFAYNAGLDCLPDAQVKR